MTKLICSCISRNGLETTEIRSFALENDLVRTLNSLYTTCLKRKYQCLIQYSRKTKTVITAQLGKLEYPERANLNFDILHIVRSLGGKNWQDRDKADKVGISFPRDS